MIAYCTADVTKSSILSWQVKPRMLTLSVCYSHFRQSLNCTASIKHDET